MKNITEYLSTNKIKTKPNKISFYDIVNRLNNIANDEKLVDIINVMQQYYDEPTDKKIFDFICDLVESGYEISLKKDYKNYFSETGKITFLENSKVIAFSQYNPFSNGNPARNFSFDIFDCEHLTWYAVILSISENLCILHDLHGDSYKQFKRFIDEGALDFDTQIHGKFNEETIDNVCKNLRETLL